MLTSLGSPTPIFRLRPGASVDSLGDTVTSWATPERKRIPRAAVDDGAGTSAYGLVSRAEGTADLLIVGTFDLTASDRIEVGGEVWRIDGKPVTRRSLASGAHVEARLVRLEVSQ